MKDEDSSPLGKPTVYLDQYDASLLFPMSRAPNRRDLGLTGAPPFFGADLWTAYELGWLNLRGKPQLALAQLVLPCESANFIESKSLKLYLNSFSGTRFKDADQLRQRLRTDLGEAAWRGADGAASVGVRLIAPADFAREQLQELAGLSLDRLDIECAGFDPAPERLSARQEESPVSETLVSDLLKSNCPVTGQPDWGSVQIAYTGAPIDQEGLLHYLLGFRNRNEFHEQCVERIFMDIWTRCRPLKLTVYARYTRRGGLDINPFRTSHPQAPPASVRTARQ